MNKIFAIGDIHGCCETFKKLLLDNLKIEKADEIYCLGDYIDRGPNSKGVIDLILELRSGGYQIRTLRGNHEQMLLDSIENKSEIGIWLRNGADKTLQSFGVKFADQLQEKYLTFFEETKLCIQTKDFIFVHAGLNFDRKNILEDKEAMLWVRGFDPFQPALRNQILIHGHTPESLNYILNQKGNCINIDGGCVYTHIEGMGNLIAFDLNTKHFVAEKNCD